MVPAVQATQVADVDAPVAADAVPAAHKMQLVWPTATAKEPAGQPRHTVAPLPEYEPAAQSPQLEAPEAAP